MAAQYEEKYNVNATVNQLLSIIRSPTFSSPLNVEMKSENPAPWGIWFRFHHGMSAVSWGEKITITLTPTSPSTTLLQIHSECGMPTQVIDWGKNKSVVCNVYERIMAMLNSQAPAHNMPGSNATHNAPRPQPQSTGIKFCFKCGNRLDINAAFCSRCGQKQP